ncbi:MAG: ABC transporter ATP-binding protein/permease [Spirochaetaceae bacterium]|jgi:ATP-binding cassette subfamily B protein|nr:ABC transporter ATP-binding protein/permease [Spirochaetaceae bacterium]
MADRDARTTRKDRRKKSRPVFRHRSDINAEASAKGQRNKYDADEYLDEGISLKNIKGCIKYIARVKWRMLISLGLSVVASIVSLMGPLFIEQALDVAIPAKNYTQLFTLASLLTGSILLAILLGTIRNVIMAQAGQTIIHDIRYDLFEHLQKLPFSYYDSRPHGKIFVRVVPYVNSVSDALSNGVLNFIIEILNIIFIIFFMYRVSPILATTTLLGLPVLAAFIWAIKNQQRKAWQRVSNKNSNLNAYIQESMDGVRVTQAFDRQAKNRGIMDNLTDQRNREWMRAQYISNTTWFSTETISQLVFSLVYIVGVYVMHPMASFGVLLVMGSYAWRFWQPIQNLANVYNTFVTGMSYLDRIFDTLAEPPVVADLEEATEIPPMRGHVSFENVSFAYEPGNKVLKEVVFTAEPNETVAIVGPTGAGKTTIVNLLSRFYNIDEGRVLIDGIDIMRTKLASLRNQMGIMLQDSYLFTGTIADNIRYGKLDATDEEVRAAAELIGAHNFIERLPEGYNTEVNDRNGGISVGEKQLIAFARVLLSDPRILILDEATSNIDTSTEQLVQKGIRTLMKGRTSFIIAHRLSTIRDCSRIMYIDNGQIKESGTHDELMAKKGLYYELCMAQYAI